MFTLKHFKGVTIRLTFLKLSQCSFHKADKYEINSMYTHVNQKSLLHGYFL